MWRYKKDRHAIVVNKTEETWECGLIKEDEIETLIKQEDLASKKEESDLQKCEILKGK